MEITNLKRQLAELQLSHSKKPLLEEGTPRQLAVGERFTVLQQQGGPTLARDLKLTAEPPVLGTDAEWIGHTVANTALVEVIEKREEVPDFVKVRLVAKADGVADLQATDAVVEGWVRYSDLRSPSITPALSDGNVARNGSSLPQASIEVKSRPQWGCCHAPAEARSRRMVACPRAPMHMHA